jgi:hypothetical protein
MTESQLNTLIATNIPDNTTQFVTPARLREVLLGIVSTEFERIKAPVSILVDGANTLSLLAGETLEAITANPDGSNSLKVGFSLGTAELLDTDLEGLLTFIPMNYIAPTNITLHLTGECTVVAYKQKL